MRRWVKIASFIGFALGMVVVFIPWKILVQQRLETFLAKSGVHHPLVSVAGFGWDGIELNDISFGDKTPLTLRHVKVNYSLRDLWNRTVKGISLSDLAIEMEKTGDRWVIHGLEDFVQSSESTAPPSLPVKPDLFNGLPATITLEKGMLRVRMDKTLLEAPLDIQWESRPARVQLQSDGLAFRNAVFQVAAAKVSMDAELDGDKTQWSGTWQAQNIALTGMSTATPLLSASGTLNATANNIILEGSLQSTDKQYASRFMLRYDLAHPENSSLALKQGQLPWGGGALIVSAATIPFSGKGFTLPVEVRNIAVGELLKVLTGGKATATGTVSGLLPVIVGPDGTIQLGKAHLQAANAGKIVMQPNAIPGDNEQITLVREILKDLNYTLLSIEGQNEAGNRLSVMLQLEGNNPQVLGGRPVKLKVHLTGDVLHFLKQNITNLTDPATLLKTHGHTTH